MRRDNYTDISNEDSGNEGIKPLKWLWLRFLRITKLSQHY